MPDYNLKQFSTFFPQTPSPNRLNLLPSVIPNQETLMSITGSCLCGEVTFAINKPFNAIGHCYCSLCRKPRSGTYKHWALLGSNQFQWTGGKQHLGSYEYAPGKEHLRCNLCSDVLVSNEDGIMAKVAIDVVDPDARPMQHIFVGSKTVWQEIADRVLRH